MGEYNEAFVAFDVVKMKHAVAVAEGGRGGEVDSSVVAREDFSSF